MNSLVSYNWLRHYVDLNKIEPEEFAKKISLCGPAVEKIWRRDDLLNNVVVGKIVSVDPHPNADKLRICMVDVGATPRVARGDVAHTQIVCGGSNLFVGQYVALAKVGARVQWHGEGEPVTLEAAKLRGVESFGMICGANEIGLGDAFPHEEKEILDFEKELGKDAMKIVKPGTPVADLLALSDDVLMDIEVTGNRVDAMGMIGMAREASAILGRKFLWKPTLIKKTGKRETGSGKRDLSITIYDKALCPRYMGVRITGVKNGPSPWWMKQRLVAGGLKPISLLVDITNYILLEYAQPMHVFDVAKLRMKGKMPEIHVRRAKDGEKMKALDGKEYELNSHALVIADSVGPVAVAGIMGGEHSGAYDDTTDIVFECAAFDPVSIRRTSRRINLYSDSQLRFEKGLSPEGIPCAMARAVELALELGGGKVIAIEDVYPVKEKAKTFAVTSTEVEQRMGVKIPATRQKQILKDLGFHVTGSASTIKATAPWWRHFDIEAGVDLIEEIARVYGYGNIPAILPVGDLPPRPSDMETVWEDRVKEVAKGAGLTECYTYSFVSQSLYEKTLHSPERTFRISNPLSDEFAIMRTTIVPSLLTVVAENQERFRQQMIFEVANAYIVKKGWNELPDEKLELACAFFGVENAFKQAKGFTEHLLKELGVREVEWSRMSQDGFWHPGRSIQVFKKGELIATIGEVAPTVLSNLKIDGSVIMIHAQLETLFRFAGAGASYTPPGAFPESKRDLAVVVDGTVEYALVEQVIRSASALATQVEWFDTYTGTGLADGKKSLAMHLTFVSNEKTLTTQDVDQEMANIIATLKKKCGGEVR